MSSWHWSILTDQDGTVLFQFEINPDDITGMFPERTYTSSPTLSGPTMLQFPDYDTRLRSVSFDIIPDENIAHRDFLLGTSESDNTSLLFLDALDSDGQLTPYWLKIPEEYKHWRPRGYRESGAIPIRVEEVRPVPEGQGKKRWRSEMFFRIIPKPNASEYFAVTTSQLDSLNYLISDHLNLVYSYDNNLATYADETTESYTASDAWPDFTVAAGDIIYFGCASKFYGIDFTMDTAESVTPDVQQGGVLNTFEYYNGSWTSIASAIDYTENFVKDATVVWGALSDWEAGSLSGQVAGGPSTSSYYWMRMTVGSLTTAFTIDTALRS